MARKWYSYIYHLIYIGGYPDYYFLRYSRSEQTNTTDTVQVTAASHTLTDLQLLSEYTVSVASHNFNGLSDYSQSILFGTFGM